MLAVWRYKMGSPGKYAPGLPFASRQSGGWEFGATLDEM
jgi:hypothetical protein